MFLRIPQEPETFSQLLPEKPYGIRSFSADSYILYN